MEMLNKVLMHGRLTAEPDLKTLASGSKVCNIQLACNRTYKDGGGNKVEAVCFITVVAWGKLGELVAQHKRKGDAVIVTGRLDLQTWEKEGQKRSRHEIVAESVEFIGKKSDG